MLTAKINADLTLQYSGQEALNTVCSNLTFSASVSVSVSHFIGTQTVIVVPRPFSDRISMVPPSRSVSCLTMDIPRPVP